MKNKLAWRFFSAFVLITMVAVLVLNFFVSLKLRENFETKITEKLESNAILVGDILREKLISGDWPSIQAQTLSIAAKLGLRITVIGIDGVVLADSEKDPAAMENHGDRPEIIRAISTGTGYSKRFSETLNFNMSYVAVRVAAANQPIGVIRFALPLSEVQFEIRLIHRAVLWGAIIATIISLTIAYFASKSITSPIKEMQLIARQISKGDFSKKIPVGRKDELGELAESLNKMSEELQNQITSLKLMDKVRTDFVANVSHELKTPLTAIKGFTETLEDGAMQDEEKAKRFIGIIKKHTDRLTNIVGDLLTLSELELRKENINMEVFDLRQLLDEITLGFGHALNEKKQQLNLSADGEDFKINADIDKIEQVFVNLIDNAVKYTGENGIIKVELTESGDELTVTVADNGQGIPQEHISRVFERFYRVDKARSKQLGGTGLGLGIAKHIVIAHKGDIEIQSTTGKGTRAIVVLPKK